MVTIHTMMYATIFEWKRLWFDSNFIYVVIFFTSINRGTVEMYALADCLEKVTHMNFHYFCIYIEENVIIDSIASRALSICTTNGRESAT